MTISKEVRRLEPTPKHDTNGKGKATHPAEPEAETKSSERNPEASKKKKHIVQDLLGDFSEQTGASFG
jgi:hypothetical protein